MQSEIDKYFKHNLKNSSSVIIYAVKYAIINNGLEQSYTIRHYDGNPNVYVTFYSKSNAKEFVNELINFNIPFCIINGGGLYCCRNSVIDIVENDWWSKIPNNIAISWLENQVMIYYKDEYKADMLMAKI